MNYYTQTKRPEPPKTDRQLVNLAVDTARASALKYAKAHILRAIAEYIDVCDSKDYPSRAQAYGNMVDVIEQELAAR